MNEQGRPTLGLNPRSSKGTLGGLPHPIKGSSTRRIKLKWQRLHLTFTATLLAGGVQHSLKGDLLPSVILEGPPPPLFLPVTK